MNIPFIEISPKLINVQLCGNKHQMKKAEHSPPFSGNGALSLALPMSVRETVFSVPQAPSPAYRQGRGQAGWFPIASVQEAWDRNRVRTASIILGSCGGFSEALGCRQPL